MAAVQQDVFYEDERGRQPFAEWFLGLTDALARKRILARTARLRTGNFGDCRPVGAGVHELRIDHGPGYRVYYARAGHTLVLLLCGGDKRSQASDIQKAQTYWRRYKERT
jgi:putative addiction module killer protein